ncbi:ABC-type nitrate/sulfonate/bicarbonate transport system, ATpase component [Clostridium aceticum]|uniref:ABC-type nitrate/sulfonate/bicarbonate transport system, ATpase component n=1 Tax=Clostridium aceticum TaxID=84022 RepID=A0A0G3WCH2_9CLOT|nr:ABC transporter ATP-binding protein [Clostridium aceticum]AKL96386.1 ABC-type nitrate/sulfonate/bicarbonate transport system, ATpase component [Clostridium aceticum]
MILQLKKIHKKYKDIQVFNNLSLEIKESEILCIIGPSGCGKSTILNLISGLIKPDEGELMNKSNKIAYVFQEDRLLPWRTVYKNIKLVDQYSSKEEVDELIADMGLKGFENKFPHELSGGMRQRCSIARAFNYQSELLLMDEPFKSLDYDLRKNMLNHLIKLWKKTKNAIVFVTHEIDEALLLGNRIIVLSDRPTNILKIFQIDCPQDERKLQDKKFIEIRSEIIDLLAKKKKKGA